MQRTSSHSARQQTDASSPGFVDIHCHCLPGLDDGPESMTQSVALCAALADDGIGIIVATPHQLGRFEARTPAPAVRTAVDNLNQRLAEEAIDVLVLPGGEVRLDERIGELVAADKVVTLADRRRHILIELPSDVFIDLGPLLPQLRAQGMEVVLAHPERNRELIRYLEVVEGWLDDGMSLQVTAASLVGSFGRRVQSTAWDMVRAGWATLVATDAHDTGLNGPCMTTAFELLAAALGMDAARQLCIENPLRIVRATKVPSAYSLGKREVG